MNMTNFHSKTNVLVHSLSSISSIEKMEKHLIFSETAHSIEQEFIKFLYEYKHQVSEAHERAYYSGLIRIQ